MMGFTRAAILGLALVAVGSGCVARSDGPDTSATAQPSPSIGEVRLVSNLRPFDSCEPLLDYFQDNAIAEVQNGNMGAFGGHPTLSGDVAVAEDAAVPTTAAVGSAPVQRSAAAGEFSTTNVAEIGVDEPDLVKTDGRVMVVAHSGRLEVVDLTGGTPQLVGALELEGMWTEQMILSGDRVLLLSATDSFAVSEPLVERSAPMWWPVGQLVEVDISDPANPTVAHKLSVDGSMVSARVVDGVARVVVRSGVKGIEPVWPLGSTDRDLERAVDATVSRISDSDLDDWLPAFALADGSGDVVDQGRAVECTEVHEPPEFSGTGMLTVLSVDLEQGLGVPGSSVSVVAGGENVYASTESLYVATGRWWEAQTASVDPDTGDVVAPDGQVTTEIHKFDISDPHSISYEGSGQVDGYILNQFSMSEHQGDLRVASTLDPPWWGAEEREQSESLVTVLRPDGQELVELGRVGGLGKGETIHSVRFLGDKGYVVTFRRTDPLYVVDLSDPAAPTVEGELKILGYSAYLHPVTDDLLIGVGQDATDQGVVTGTQVSLFDVSDPSDPRRIAQHTFSDANSEAEWDHHAFLWWAPENLLVMPLQRWSHDTAGGIGEHFAGAVGLEVTPAGIRERGLVEHPTSSSGPVIGRPLPVEPGIAAEPALDAPVETTVPPDAGISQDELIAPVPEWTPPIRRAVVVGDRLLTISEAGLLTSGLSSFDPVGFVAWAG